MDKKKVRILFLCTANACRSQMAEAWAEYLKRDEIEAYSAGVMPFKVSERAITVMEEAGVDMAGHYSKHVEDLAGLEFDYVITLCGSAKEICPTFPGKTKMIHHGFNDPAAVIGTTDQVMTAFRKARDEIKAFIKTLPQSLNENPTI